MSNQIYCTTNENGFNNFYLIFNNKKYYLFSQNYHKGVNNVFNKGISLNMFSDYKLAKKDHCVLKTMSKFIPYIKYIEKEYDLKILRDKKEAVRSKKSKLLKLQLGESY